MTAEEFYDQLYALRLELFRINAVADGLTFYANDGSGEVEITDKERLEYIKTLSETAIKIVGSWNE